MRIGDAAAAAGTTPRALRLYEQRGLLPAPVRTPAGQREYGPDDVARVRVVRELLALGLTIEDVRACVDRLSLLDVEAIRSRRVPEGVCARTSPVVNRRIEALDEEIARLTRMRDELASRAAATRGDRSPEETTT
ncbi:MerR family transcriptional regulator [Streptomyces sp. NPDC090109]|uniref:MerR family transcriptional regulator n=1 Tax=unclassified Streptomyces TaxID=2593676 RepID=UPI000EF773FA|nr:MULTISPECIES: MerR family transcriptional regulator [unclassified Streptomyces]MZE56564.1 MerR family transcriptional regulator [Streptomyces sp. SID5770]